MIHRIIELSARYRALVLLAAIALGVAGWASLRRVELDAIPDLSDTQVIVFTEWKGRSPSLVEDQITYPLVTALLGAPHVHEARGQSMFGMSFVYVVFDEGTDPYWARSRVLEYSSAAQGRLPESVVPRLGPDASGIGWVYQYALVDRSKHRDLGELRTLHDYSIRYALASIPGVAEVATVGGFEPQFQVTIDPVKLRSYGLTFDEVADAVRRSNSEVGARVLEMSEREYFVRGRGYVSKSSDIGSAVVRRGEGAVPVRVSDVATVAIGAELRRGAADFDGEGEVVSGIVIARQGENARDLIGRVEARLDELRPSLPEGVEIVPVYSRAALIDRAIATLKGALVEEMVVVAIVIILFLLHLRSALLPILSLPLAVLAAFIPMALFHIPATIMSLGGIAIAIGATVDAEIVMVEAAHKALEHAPEHLSPEARRRLLADAAREVTPAIFFSLLIIAASFLPVFGLTGQAGRLFRPLALTKTFVMLGAALLSITVAPALRDFLLRGRIRSEAAHPISRVIRRVYEPFVHVALHNPRTTVAIGLCALLSALPLVPKLGSEFMPPLDEGDVLYMPTTLSGISIEEARRQLQTQDALLKEFPEVVSVLGKVGRAETPTDPAPLSMVETMVRLAPRSEWRKKPVARWYQGRSPEWARPALTWLWPEEAPISREELVELMNAKLQIPGWSNAFTQPIRNRVDMLSTGIRTAVGIKVYGRDLAAIERAGGAIERVVHGVPGTRSAFFERQTGATYVDIVPRREALARFGLGVADLDGVVESAVGGQTVATTIDGRARYAITVRLEPDFRQSVEALRELSLPVPQAGAKEGAERHVRLAEVADVAVTSGPPMIKDESGMLVGYVYVDVDDKTDLGSYVDAARAAVDAARERGEVTVPDGGRIRWTGQYEELLQTRERMKLLVPIALFSVVFLLYLQFRNLTEVLIVLLSVPFALVGSIWALYLLGYHVSTAVGVGIIALVGLAAQTGVVMIVYIDQAYEKRRAQGRIRSLEDIIEAHAEGTIQRVRPKLMTIGTMLAGLVPVLWSEGSGADVMKRIAAPMVGGLATSAFLTLEIIPVIYTYWRYEQLLLGRLEVEAPRVLVEVERLVRVLQGAGAGLAIGCVAYVWTSAPWALALTLAALGGLVLATVAYGVTRRAFVAQLAAPPPAAPPPAATPPPMAGPSTGKAP